MAAGATYEPIATQTLASAAASITFNSIPSTYTDLKLLVVFKGATNSGIELRFNSDTSTNYSYTYIGGNGTAASSSRATSLSYYPFSGTITTTSVPVLATCDIFSYAGSTFKTMLSQVSGDKNGSGNTELNVGLWRSTAAITSITIGVGENYDIGTTATLYGIKAA